MEKREGEITNIYFWIFSKKISILFACFSVLFSFNFFFFFLFFFQVHIKLMFMQSHDALSNLEVSNEKSLSGKWIKISWRKRRRKEFFFFLFFFCLINRYEMVDIELIKRDPQLKLFDDGSLTTVSLIIVQIRKKEKTLPTITKIWQLHQQCWKNYNFFLIKNEKCFACSYLHYFNSLKIFAL